MFTSADPTVIDYDIKFSDTQRLRTLETKICVAVAVLEQSIAIGEDMLRHCQKLNQLLPTQIGLHGHEEVEARIARHISSLKLHKTACKLLSRQLHSTQELVSSRFLGHTLHCN